MDRYHILLIVLFAVFLISLGAYFNVLGMGDALAGLGGGFVGILAGFLTWGGAGGGPTVGVVYVSLLIAGFIVGGLLMKGINKLRGVTSQQSTAVGYQSAPSAVIPVSYQSAPTQAPAAAPVQLQSEPTKKEETK